MSNRVKQHQRPLPLDTGPQAPAESSGHDEPGSTTHADLHTPRGPGPARWFGTGLLGSAGAAVAAAAAPILAGNALALWHAPGVRTVDEVLGAAVLAVGGAGAAWLAVWAAVAAGALLIAGIRGTAAPVHRLVARRGTPRVVRRALTGALGLSLLAGGAPAMAANDGGPADLGWDAAAARTVATTEDPSGRDAGAEARARGARAPAPVAHAVDLVASGSSGRDPEVAPAPSPHVVTRGESLWSIAATHLGPDATASDVAAAWPRWYEANLSAVGDDPDHITPGLVLEPPAAQPTTGG